MNLYRTGHPRLLALASIGVVVLALLAVALFINPVYAPVVAALAGVICAVTTVATLFVVLQQKPLPHGPRHEQLPDPSRTSD
jgi:multisubunit Na+/H+ antiporter MnhB subunit